jgi:hypothetical protein
MEFLVCLFVVSLWRQSTAGYCTRFSGRKSYRKDTASHRLLYSRTVPSQIELAPQEPSQCDTLVHSQLRSFDELSDRSL